MENLIMERQADEKREFRRLRNFYRKNFINGESDEAFVVWVEGMCAEEAGRLDGEGIPKINGLLHGHC